VVASRAAVNKTTIYRRWPSRAALVTALVDRMRAPLRASPLPDTGRLESDLVEAFARNVVQRLEHQHDVDGTGSQRDPLGAEIRKLGARAAALRNPSPLGVLGNPDFESSVLKDSRIYGWDVTSCGGVTIALDEKRPHGGRRAVKISPLTPRSW